MPGTTFPKRWMSYLVISVCIGCPRIGAGQERAVVVPVQDKSEPNSPLQVSGELSFADTVIANEVETAHSELVKVRNISDKPILLVVASLDEAGPRSSPEDFDLTTDNFFKDKPIQPGDEVTLLQQPRGERYTINPFKSATGEGRSPKAEFRLQFVQFADGSIFGNLETGKKYIASRQSTLSALKALDKAYREQGESGLLQTLEQYPTAKRPDALWAQIREQQRVNGTEPSVLFVRRLISMGMEHESALQSAVGNK
jgi:hypothetical protein